MEADETYFGEKAVVTKRTIRGKSGPANKHSEVALVERGGSVRSFHMDRATQANVTEIVKENVAREAELHTDESNLYWYAKNHVSAHFSIMHTAGIYSKDGVTTNTLEGVFSIFKRGVKGAKAQKAKGRPKAKDERPQSERFIETAREIGCDESGEGFERVFSKLVPPKRAKPL